jgi:uncharacterized protein YprB with RNaseH-like and TPR domain
MDLGEKLKYYQEIANIQRKNQIPEQQNLCNELNGRWLDPTIPSVIQIETLFPYEQFVPNMTLAQQDFVILPLLTKNQFSRKIRLPQILIFDIETTGLMGGTGTYPFLLGFGIFDADGLCVRQFFLPDFGREVHVYLHLLQERQNKQILLSFNGKTFDYPLLCNRFILNRIENPFANYEHLDLLHVARRLWKNILSSCSLENIEKEIFLFSRWGDLPGDLIPQAYFEFLRSGTTKEIKKIIQHNQQDIVSLGRLLLHLNLLENNPASDQLSGHELQSLFHLAIKNSDVENTDFLLNQIKRRSISLPAGILIDFSLLLKRVGHWQRAEKIWLELLRSGTNVIFASEELAKYYEHRKLDFQRAKTFTERGLKHIEVLTELEALEMDMQLYEQFVYRLNRLRRKILDAENT